MNLHLLTKRILIGIVLVLSLVGYSQEEVQKKNEEKSITFNSKERQRLLTLSSDFNLPITFGDNFLGEGLSAKTGLGFSFQLFPYKQFFIGFDLNSTYFDVKDRTVVGNYAKTTLNEFYVNIGYEFLPLDKIRLGVMVSIYGKSRFKNKSEDKNKSYQIDHGRAQSFGFNIKYELNQVVMLYVDYNYCIVKPDIKVPNELENLFEKGTYHKIGIGLAFNIGRRDLLSRFF